MYELHTVIFALTKVVGEHVEFNQGMIVLKILEDYKIRNKLGYLVIHNLGSNDQLIETVTSLLNEKKVFF